MRTRALNSMTNHEIETYLKRNDVIFIPVGTVETHNPLPVDCEHVMAEAWAKLFAEQFDAVYMPNLMYFCSGGTDTMCGTVKIGMADGMKYLYAISRSLLAQGFKRQVFIPGHGPSRLMIHPVIHQILDDTKVPMLFLEPNYLFQSKGILPRPSGRPSGSWKKFKAVSDENGMGDHAKMLGAYKIIGRLDDVPTGAEANLPETIRYEGQHHNDWFPEHDIINECSSIHAPAPYWYDKETQHAASPLPETREEIEREAAIGEAYMRDLVSKVDFNEHLDILKRLQQHIQDKVVNNPATAPQLPPDRWAF